MTDGLSEATWDFRLFTFLFTAFGFAALFLAMTGLYATMALTVSRRKREFGVRRALGASGRDNLRLALMQGLSQVALALALGLLLAAVVARLLAALLLGVDPWDLSVFGAVAAAFLATGLVACLLPAWRAARVHPLSAMRDA
jgi:ABC-type antimicrobial peptide transport system permease subunit